MSLNPIKIIARKIGLRPWIVTIALAVLLVAGGLVGKCSYDRSVVSRAITQANNKTLGRTIEANEAGASEQLTDAKTLSDLKRSYDDALNNPSPDASADARTRHACQQLRTAGYREADLPASCGRAGTGDTGTPPHP